MNRQCQNRNLCRGHNHFHLGHTIWTFLSQYLGDHQTLYPSNLDMKESMSLSHPFLSKMVDHYTQYCIYCHMVFYVIVAPFVMTLLW